MRFNETCTLISTSYTTDDEGVPIPHETPSVVFCNPFSVGASTWSSMYEIGMSAGAEIQIRTCDYKGQRTVIYRERRYSVEYVREEGDFTRLTLRHQQSDDDPKGDDSDASE